MVILWFIPCFFLILIKLNKRRVLIETICFFILLIICKKYSNGHIQFPFETLFIKNIDGVLLMQIGVFFGGLIDYFKLHNNYKNTKIMLIISLFIHGLFFVVNGKRLVDLNTMKFGNMIFYLLITSSESLMVICLSILLEKIDKKTF